jgi:hypothetical protein
MNSFFLGLIDGSKKEKRESMIKRHFGESETYFDLPNGERCLCFFKDYSESEIVIYKRKRRLSMWYYESMNIFRYVFNQVYEICHSNIDHKFKIRMYGGKTLEEIGIDQLSAIDSFLSKYNTKINLIKRQAILL